MNLRSEAAGTPTSGPIYRRRPEADAIAGAADPAAERVFPGIWLSRGLSNSYLLTTDDGRIVVNAGMGFEGPVHRMNFDAVDQSPIRYIILTQGHYDHVGGVDYLRDSDTQIVAQANWRRWRADNERLAPFRAANSAFAFASTVVAAVESAKQRTGLDSFSQAAPVPDVVVEESMVLDAGGRHVELISTPGGETTDSLVVWLPDEGVCLCGNVFGALFGHIPNLVTIRGDRYRDALTVIDTIEKIRRLQPDILLTGHFDPIQGKELIDAELTRLRDAVQYVHDETVAGMNAGKDVWTLMREISLPVHLELGEGYGKVSWDVRAIWENYSGWFHHRSTTELYSIGSESTASDLVELAGMQRLLDRVAAHLEAGQPVHAIDLAELVIRVDDKNERARALMVAAHRALLAASTNFWESAWLRKQIRLYRQPAKGTSGGERS